MTVGGFGAVFDGGYGLLRIGAAGVVVGVELVEALHDERGDLVFLVRGVIVDSFLEAFAYALCGDGVEVAGAQDLVDDGGVRRLCFGGKTLWVVSVYV